MTKDFEERWGFAPDSDYEIRKTTNLTKPMTEQEIKESFNWMGEAEWRDLHGE